MFGPELIRINYLFIDQLKPRAARIFFFGGVSREILKT